MTGVDPGSARADSKALPTESHGEAERHHPSDKERRAGWGWNGAVAIVFAAATIVLAFLGLRGAALAAPALVAVGSAGVAAYWLFRV